MKRIVLFFVALCAVMFSCSKYRKPAHIPVSYAVENSQDTTPQDIYLPITGKKYVSVEVKFLTGNTTDSVTLEIKGLPQGITVSPQRSSGVPTYYYKYIYTTTNMPVGTYPVSIVATAPATEPKVYNFNLIVIPNDCAALFPETMKGSNSCSDRSYAYTTTLESPNKNELIIHNLGGYGLETETHVILNCEQDSLYISSQNIGNGVIMEGKGTFTDSKLTIYYSAVTAPGAAAEVCTATLSK